MTNLLIAAQLIVAISVAYVWVFRYEVIIKEFKQFELSDLTRTFVGASKVALATLLVTGIWYPSLISIPAMLMGLFMLAAQYFHFKIKNPFIKHLPSLIFLILCIFIALVSMDIF
jgi:hypothetical protein